MDDHNNSKRQTRKSGRDYLKGFRRRHDDLGVSSRNPYDLGMEKTSSRSQWQTQDGSEWPYQTYSSHDSTGTITRHLNDQGTPEGRIDTAMMRSLLRSSLFTGILL